MDVMIVFIKLLEKPINFHEINWMKKIIKSLTVSDINHWMVEMKDHLHSFLNKKCDSFRLDIFTGDDLDAFTHLYLFTTYLMK